MLYTFIDVGVFFTIAAREHGLYVLCIARDHIHEHLGEIDFVTVDKLKVLLATSMSFIRSR